MNIRRKRNLLLQKLFWNPLGFKLLKGYVSLRNRIDSVLLNQSLDSNTNGEYWLLDNLPDKAIVLDVGFNKGNYTEQVLQRCPTATIHAFDPAKSLQAIYQEKFSMDKRVRFYPLALSNECGELVFYDYDNQCSSLTRRVDAGEEKTSYKVTVKTLDIWAAEQKIEKIDLLKIDAEGFDANVLEGTVGLFKSEAIGAVMFEFASGWIGNRRFLGDVARLVEPTNYKMFQLFNGFLAPLEYDVFKEKPPGRMYVLLPQSSWARCLRIEPRAALD